MKNVMKKIRHITTTKTIGVVLVLLVGGGVWMLIKYSAQFAGVGSVPDSSATHSLPADPEQEVHTVPEEPPMEGYRWFANNDYGFAFQYPDDMSVTLFGTEEGGDMVLAEGKGNASFQIFITDFDEDISAITTERVHQDLPDLVIEDPQEAVLASGLRALIFWSEDAAIGRTREVWIVHAGSVYQVTAPAEFDTELAKIMTTWRFEY